MKRIFVFIILLTMTFLQAQVENNTENFSSQEENSRGITFAAGVEITTQFLDRGLLTDDQGLIVQPYLEMYISLYKQENGILSNLDLFLGTWGSFHGSNPTGTGSDFTVDPKAWFEQDLYMGLNFVFMERFLFDACYCILTSPNDSFETIHEITLKIGFNDEGLLGENFSLSPYVFMAFEIEEASDGINEGVYMEIGMNPAYAWDVLQDYPLTIAFPMKIGFSLDNYYDFGEKDDDSFGFAEIGISLSIPLAFIPKRYGEWEATAKCNFVLLDGHLAKYNLPKDDDIEVIGIFGLSMNY